MKKKLLLLGLGICLLFTACSGKNAAEKGQQPNTKQEQGTEAGEGSDETDKEDGGEGGGQEETPQEPSIKLTKPPEVTFDDYSQEFKDEETGTVLLSVIENCPIVSIPENEAAAEKINMAFEQKHIENQAYIEEDAQEARSAYEGLSEEEEKDWGCYGYGSTYKMVYASNKVLSIEGQNYEWQGASHPNTWTNAYCFDAATGKLLTLSDIFIDKEKGMELAEEHIMKVITQDPYKDALLDDYESYVPDILTEEVFYLGEKGLMIICNPYMVTVYAAGVIEVEVPYEELDGVLNEAYMKE